MPKKSRHLYTGRRAGSSRIVFKYETIETNWLARGRTEGVLSGCKSCKRQRMFSFITSGVEEGEQVRRPKK